MSDDLERWQGGGLDVQTLRDNIAPEATDGELGFFAQVCRHVDLDPFAGQIYLIGRNQRVGRDKWRKVHKPQISVDGRLVIASRTGRLLGIEGPMWCGPRRYSSDGEKLPLVWDDLWDDDDMPPYAARALVHVAGWKVPANGTAKWSEFAVYEDADRRRLGRFWKDAPSHMLGKVALALALRRGFPEVQTAVSFVDGAGEPDDNALVAEASAAASGRKGDGGGNPPPIEEWRANLIARMDSLPSEVFDQVQTEARNLGIPNARSTRFHLSEAHTVHNLINGALRMWEHAGPDDSPDEPTPTELHDGLPEANTSEPGGERYDPDDVAATANPYSPEDSKPF